MKQTTVDLGEETTLYEKPPTPKIITSKPRAVLFVGLFLQAAGVLPPCVWWVVHYPTGSDYINFNPLLLAYTAALLFWVVIFLLEIKDVRSPSEKPDSVTKFRLLVFLLPSGLNIVFSYLFSYVFPPYFQTGMHFHIVVYLTCDMIFSFNWTLMPYIRHSQPLRSVCGPLELGCICLGWMLFSFSLVGIFRHLYLGNFAMSLWCVIYVGFDTVVIASLGLTIEEKAKSSVPMKGLTLICVVILCMFMVFALMVYSTGPVFRMIYGDVFEVRS